MPDTPTCLASSPSHPAPTHTSHSFSSSDLDAKTARAGRGTASDSCCDRSGRSCRRHIHTHNIQRPLPLRFSNAYASHDSYLPPPVLPRSLVWRSRDEASIYCHLWSMPVHNMLIPTSSHPHPTLTSIDTSLLHTPTLPLALLTFMCSN